MAAARQDGTVCEIFSPIFSGGRTSNHTHVGGEGG